MRIQNYRITGSTFSRVAALPNGTLIATGRIFGEATSGWLVYRSRNQGASWSTVDSALPVSGNALPRALAVDRAGRIYAVGTNNFAIDGPALTVLRLSEDDGLTWRTIYTGPEGESIVSMTAFQQGVYLAGSSGPQGSETAVLKKLEAPSFAVQNVAAFARSGAGSAIGLGNGGEVLVHVRDATVSPEQHVLRRSVNLTAWTDLPFAGARGLRVSPHGPIFRFLTGNVIEKTYDTGLTWVNTNAYPATGSGTARYLGTSESGNTVFVLGLNEDAGSTGSVLRLSRDAGYVWETLGPTFPFDISDGAFTANGELILVATPFSGNNGITVRISCPN
ncbi:MAG TPA: sialidase family protein [Bdellovibrionales bacterium]|nr:sialidase family protein [Bdellovibrionales bacterium]